MMVMMLMTVTFSDDSARYLHLFELLLALCSLDTGYHVSYHELVLLYSIQFLVQFELLVEILESVGAGAASRYVRLYDANVGRSLL